MRLHRSSVLAATASVLALALSGCGSVGKGLLDSQQSDSLNAALDEVNSAVDAGDCVAAEKASLKLRAITAQLPPTVDTGLKSNLGEGAAKVGDLALADCNRNATTTTSSSTTTSSTSTSTSTTPTSSTTTTTPTTTTTAPTTTTTTTTDTGGGTPPTP